MGNINGRPLWWLSPANSNGEGTGIMDAVQLFYKKHKAKLLYLFFGGLTTAVSIGVFALFTRLIPLGELVANLISWVFAVLFAFLTNRRWVFPEGRGDPIVPQMVRFYLGRLSTLLIEETLLLIFVALLQCNDMAVKIAAQLVVLVLNYLISRLFIFKKQ